MLKQHKQIIILGHFRSPKESFTHLKLSQAGHLTIMVKLGYYIRLFVKSFILMWRIIWALFQPQSNINANAQFIAHSLDPLLKYYHYRVSIIMEQYAETHNSEPFTTVNMPICKSAHPPKSCSRPQGYSGSCLLRNRAPCQSLWLQEIQTDFILTVPHSEQCGLCMWLGDLSGGW